VTHFFHLKIYYSLAFKSTAAHRSLNPKFHSTYTIQKSYDILQSLICWKLFFCPFLLKMLQFI